MLPFALLGIAIVDPSFFSTELVKQRYDTFVTFIPKIVGFAVIVILLEWTLRMLFFIKRGIFGVGTSPSEE